MPRMVGYICLFINMTLAIYVNAAQPVKLWHENYERIETRAFVQLALQKAAPEYGEFKLTPVVIDSQAHAMSALQNHETIDLAVAATDKTWEASLLPIYIPLDKGLLGFRVCVIKPTQRPLFANIVSVADLKSHQIKLGVVESWPDRFVYQHYNLHTVTTKALPDLYDKLYGNDLNCISRSVFEVDNELVHHPEFMVEENLAFVYPSADIIYVSLTKPKLKEAIEYGLKRAIDDGSYEALFNKLYGDVLKRHAFYYRKMIIMHNPDVGERAMEAINRYGIVSFDKVQE